MKKIAAKAKKSLTSKTGFKVKLFSKLTGENWIVENKDKSINSMCCVYPIQKFQNVTKDQKGKMIKTEISAITLANKDIENIAVFSTKEEAYDAAIAIIHHQQKLADSQKIKEQVFNHFEIVEIENIL